MEYTRKVQLVAPGENSLIDQVSGVHMTPKLLMAQHSILALLEKAPETRKSINHDKRVNQRIDIAYLLTSLRYSL